MDPSVRETQKSVECLRAKGLDEKFCHASNSLIRLVSPHLMRPHTPNQPRRFFATFRASFHGPRTKVSSLTTTLIHERPSDYQEEGRGTAYWVREGLHERPRPVFASEGSTACKAVASVSRLQVDLTRCRLLRSHRLGCAPSCPASRYIGR